MESVLSLMPSRVTPTLRLDTRTGKGGLVTRRLRFSIVDFTTVHWLAPQVIDLNDNTFTEVGSKAVAAVLPHLEKLKVINFGDCLVRPEGAKAIADAIRDRHQHLEVMQCVLPCGVHRQRGG